MDPQDVVERAVQDARSRGAQAEAYHHEVTETQVVVHGGKVEASSRSVGRGLGMRAQLDTRVGGAFTTDTSAQGVRDLVERCLAAARISEPREVPVLPEAVPAAKPGARGENFARSELLELEDAARVGLAVRAEQSAFDHDERVRKSESATYGDRFDRIHVANSLGVQAQWEESAAGLGLEVVAAAGDEERTAFAAADARGAAGLDAEDVGRRAAVKAVSLLGSRQVATAQVPVLLDAEVGGALLGLLAEPFSAQAVLLGGSMLADKLDQSIGAEALTLWDDPFEARGVGGSPFDAEGTPAHRTCLIENGILRSYLHNAYTARRMQIPSTGNAARSGFGATVGVGPSNLVLGAGTRSPGAILADLSRGFLVEDVMGLHMANTVSGDFSLGITGHWIEDGVRAHPVEEMTIAGNLLGLLQQVVEVADDLRFDGDVASPSLLVEGLTVSGS